MATRSLLSFIALAASAVALPHGNHTGRLLNSELADCAHQGGIIGLYSNDFTSDTENYDKLYCHGVYLKGASESYLVTDPYCKTSLEKVAAFPSLFSVFGKRDDLAFSMQSCAYDDYSGSELGPMKVLQFKGATKEYLQGATPTCGSVATPLSSVTASQVNWAGNCYIVSYGRNTQQAPSTPPSGGAVARRVVLNTYSGIDSLCDNLVSPSGYTNPGGNSGCFTAQDNGANCEIGDAAAPVFCPNKVTTDPDIFVGFSEPNTNCDPALNAFRVHFLKTTTGAIP